MIHFMIGFVIGAVLGSMIYLFWMAYQKRRADNVLTQTEWDIDATEYDVPEMTDDCDMDDRPILPDDDASRRRGGVTW